MFFALMKSQPAKLVAMLVVAAALSVALYLRLPSLAERPMHCDEANHTIKAGILLEQGEYVYDPADFHGPTIYYAALPVIRLSGARTLAETNEFMFRIVPVVFGVALVIALLLILDGLGPWAVAVAAVLTAVSPAMVFYSRYYIQEVPFVFFTFGVIASGWRYARSPSLGWAIAAGVFIGLMQATKETSVLAYAAMAAGLLAAIPWRSRPINAAVKPAHGAAALAIAILVAAFFLTGHFTHPAALADAFHTYFSYMNRADGAGLHDHPWHYYLQTLLYSRLGPGVWWSEALIVVLAVVGVVAAAVKKEFAGASMRFVRFIAVYTVVLTVLYALIPYKTPWCLLGFLHGMILMAGVGVVVIVRGLRWRPLQALAVVGLGLGVWHLATQANLANGRYSADTRNPYVYAHTSSDFLRLADRLEQLAEVAPQGHDILIKVMTPDYWPLPWYARKFNRVGYWNEPPADPDADVIVTSVEVETRLPQEFREKYQAEHYGIRPEVPISVLIKKDLWRLFIERQSHA